MLAKGNCNKTVISSGSEGSAGSAASAVSRNAVPQISLIHLIEGSNCSRPQTILKQLEEWHVIHCFLRPIRRDLPSSSFLCAKSIERFYSRGQYLCKFIGTKERIYIRKGFDSQRIFQVHHHGRRFIVLEHQYGSRDVMWKRSIAFLMFIFICVASRTSSRFRVIFLKVFWISVSVKNTLLGVE